MKSFLSTSVACIAIAAVAMVSGCAKKSAGDVLARVGAKEITVADFKAECARRQANRQVLPDRQVLLDQMIDREAALQQARATGLDQSAEVQRAYEDLLIARYKNTQIEPKLAAVKVTSEEIRAAYEKDLSRFTQPAKAKLAILFIAAEVRGDSNQIAVAEARANDASRQAAALPSGAAGFGQLAVDFSDDQVTRYRGGDAGWFTADGTEGRWPAEVVSAGFSLKNAGDLSGVLRAKNGFYLVKKLDARNATVTPLEQVLSIIEHRLLLAKQQETEQQVHSQARAALKVSTDASLLATISYPNPTLGQTAQAHAPALPNSP